VLSACSGFSNGWPCGILARARTFETVRELVDKMTRVAHGTISVGDDDFGFEIRLQKEANGAPVFTAPDDTMGGAF
jgi:hypothetical protein